MAEPEDDDLDLKPADAGALFRAEMWATNAILGYWRHLLAVLVVALLAFLIYGQYAGYLSRTQRAASAQIADAQSDIADIAPLQYLGYVQGSGRADLDDSQLESAAQGLLEIGRNSSGPARMEALLKAAEVFRVAGNVDKQRESLELATQRSKGVLGFAAQGALATLDLEQGKGDAAVERLRDLMKEGDDFLAQQAALDLSLALEQLDRNDEAAAVYDEFLKRWPASPQVDEVNERLARVSG